MMSSMTVVHPVHDHVSVDRSDARDRDPLGSQGLHHGNIHLKTLRLARIKCRGAIDTSSPSSQTSISPGVRWLLPGRVVAVAVFPRPVLERNLD